MAKIQWKIIQCFKYFLNPIWVYWHFTKLALLSLFYNDFADWYYVGDTCMEPMFWIVDHFTKILGPVCVTGVILLSSSIIIIAYVIGLPFYLLQNAYVLTIALILGHWLLLNVIFYYYMAFTTEPGYPPQGAMISEAVSICKRCIAPKPPRTHHCIVCNRCILKMDHHCPWLNNCIGHFNHRYFFMFCIYAWSGVVFIMLFGIPVAYEHFFGSAQYSEISPVLINFFKDIAKYVFSEHYTKEVLLQSNNTSSIEPKSKWSETLYHSCIVYAALLSIAVFIILGGLIAWHARLISRGETSIEGHINKKERLRLSREGKVFKNPYDFGPVKNWKMFLCIGYQRPSWRILFPYKEKPFGDGMQWNYQIQEEFCDRNSDEFSKICSVKIS